MSDLTGQIASLTPEQLQALKDRLAGKRKAAPPAHIPRRTRTDGVFPVSFAQRRLWFHQQLNPGSIDYNLFGLFDIEGALDLPALAAALAFLVERHEVLRTTFSERDGEPVQIVHPGLDLPLPRVDLSGLSEARLEDESSRVLQQCLEIPFDLAAGPLLRLALVHLGPGEHLLYLIYPHIITDAWSQGLLYRDLDAAYQTLRQGGRPVLQADALQYADFASWQREQLTGPAMERLLGYWRRQLAGDPPVAELPTDRPRSGDLSSRGRRESLRLPRLLVDRVEALSRATGATPMMTLLAAWALLLSRRCGQEDVLIGSPVAGRDRPELQEILGFFVNMLVLRVRCEGPDSFRELLVQVKEVCLGAFAHQDLPFEKLVEELRPERDPTRNPFVEVIFNFIPRDTPGMAMAEGVEIGEWRPAHLLVQFDLSLVFQEEPWGYLAEVDFKADLFDPATVRRLLDAYDRVLRQAVEEPERRLELFAAVSPAERHQVLAEWNDTGAEPPRERVVHRLVAEQAARAPEAVAIAAGAALLTYRELEARANRVAQALLRRGVRRETLVAVWAARHPDTLVALLGILKAGAAYLPLDPAQPEERCRVILAESGALRLEMEGIPLPLGSDLRLTPSDLADLPADDPGGPVDPDQLAYVMYTSGSTGRPKGVAIPHRGVVRLVAGADFFAAAPGDVFVQLSPIGFDASTFEIWGCLANGARLEADPPEPTDLEALGRFLRDRGVTHMWATAELFHALVREVPDGLSGLRHLLAGGDVISPEVVRETLARFPGLHLTAGYGPTENTTFTACAELTAATPLLHGVPLGRPIPQTEVVLLDVAGAPAPIGVVGELASAGAGLARGYRDDPARTASAFVPHPAPRHPGERLYRTGDLARWLPDGTLVFLGRRDHQVKIRGFRIELGEIEAALTGHPDVAEAAVLALPRSTGGKRLVAFLRTDGEEGSLTPNPAALRDLLRRTLPAPMIPEAYVPVFRWPLTPNGKIDRAALARLPLPDSGRERNVRRPLRRIEEEMLALWREVLDLSGVGPEDDFFDLGGHSLLATRLISAVRRTWNVEVPLRFLFDHPTPAALAGLVLASRRLEAPPLVAGERPERPPLSFAQQRLWFLDRLEPGGTQYHMAELLPLGRHVDLPVLALALSAVARRHEVLRTRFGEEGGEPFQIVDLPSPIPLPVVDLRGLEESAAREAARLAATSFAHQPFDLAAGPVLRALLLRHESEDQLLVALHHIAGDGWSMGILERELFELEAAFATGQSDPLPPLPVQYADFAVWQRSWMSGEILDRQLDFWRRLLGENPPPMELPTDRPRPPVQSFAGGVRVRRLGPALTESLRGLTRRSGNITLFMVLLAGFSAWLRRLSGQRTVVLGSPITNRNRAEIEPLIGFFVNTLVLPVEIDGEARFDALLSRVRDLVLAAQEHQDLPFEKLVEALAPRRDLSRNPLYQVLFDFHTGPEAPNEDSGLPRESAICDLSLSVFAGPSSLLLGAEYATALFDASTVDRFLASIERLLAGACAKPEAAIDDLPLLEESELHQVLVEWNDTAMPAPAPPVHQAIAARAARAPESVAVEQGGRSLTYGELMEQAAVLARRLRTAEVTTETRVAVALPRSPELIVALLAILEAGGAFLPLDPEYPAARLARMLEGADLLLTTSSLTLQERTGLPRIDIDGPATVPVGPAALLLPETPEALAYVFFTSGSTGVPKGVMISRGALARYAQATTALLGLGPRDRVLQLAALGFDVTVEEIFPTLAAGATLVLPPAGGLLAPSELTRLCHSARLTGFEIPTHLWSEWTAELTTRGETLPASLRYVIIGTERVPSNRLAEWRRLGVPLLHVFGVTEATVTTLAHRVAATDPPLAEGDLLPVGRPLAGARVWVVGEHLRPLPIGVTGELVIGGMGVGRGYLGRPAQTAARFVPDPFSNEPGARLYRTGDLASRRADGLVVFRGRADQQVKIQGVRIEPGEVEAALVRHPAVRQAVAVPRTDLPGGAGIVAYVVPRGVPPETAELMSALRDQLPSAMCPAAILVLDALPVTQHGKIDTAALPPPHATRRASGISPRGDCEQRISEIWCQTLSLEGVGAEDNFFDVGGNSLLLVRVHARLREVFGREIPLVELFRYPTVRALATLLTAEEPEPRREPEIRLQSQEETAVAIVGLAGRFPGAADVDTFWANLRNGVESLTTFSEEELLAAGIPAEEIADPHYVRRRGVLADADLFDARFFGISPREAEFLDPQHRLFLETAWTALEHSGHDPKQAAGSIGVFAGCSRDTYTFHNVLPHGERLETIDETQLSLASSSTFLPTRTSYKLDLRGPSVNVQTACSTSLVAVALAHRSLLAGECDLALAGGVSLTVPRAEGAHFREGGILSPDGRCLPFDAAAAGTVGGEGVGVVVLKRLSDALAEGDTIFAVLKGSAVNNDGAAKIGFTAPSIEGQAEVIARAQEMAGISAETIGYVETHGTGTALGDATEIAALTQAFRRHTEARGFCALGSAKHNIGHADDAAGIAGLIKTVLALHQGEIPPSPYVSTPNPALGLPESPFRIPLVAEPWTAVPRRAAVSSFGIGGTNAHAVLESAPQPPIPGESTLPQLLVLSAKTRSALASRVCDLADHLETAQERGGAPALLDVAWTLQRGRQAMPHRAAFVASDLETAVAALRSAPRLTSTASRPRRPVFLFPGQGSPLAGTVGPLLRADPVFRAEMERCAELLAPDWETDLLALLDPSPEDAAVAAARLRRTEFAQPALFAVEHSLARLWWQRGIVPAAMIGHSLGEYVAACLAEVLSLPDALRLVVRRGRILQALPPGAMTAVSLPAAELSAWLEPLELDLAAENAPERSVASGEAAAIEELEARLAERGVTFRRLETSHAFHSRMMRSAISPLRQALAEIELRPPRIPYVSNLTGGWITAEQATDPESWIEHMLRPVALVQGFATLAAEGDFCALEVGPGEALTRSLARHSAAFPAAVSLPSRPALSPPEDLTAALGRLWVEGMTVDWRLWHGERERPPGRVPLPTYPFERERYWIDPPRGASAAAGRSGEIVRLTDPADWFVVPSWAPAPLPRSLDAGEGPAAGGSWLIFADTGGAADRLIGTLRHRGIDWVRIDPEDPLDLLLGSGDLAERTIVRALYLSSLTPPPGESGLEGLLVFIRAWSRARPGQRLDLTVFCAGAIRLPGEPCPDPLRAELLAAGRVVPQELPHLTLRTVDIDSAALAGPRAGERLLREILLGRERVVVLRGGERWTESFIERPLPPARLSLPPRAVCLITGGVGEIGLFLAEVFHREAGARLALVGRTPLSPGDGRLRELEESGAEILPLVADVADPETLREAIRRTRERFCRIDAVFHLAGLTAPEHYPSLLETTAATLASHRRPKLEGLLALDAALADDPPEICVAFSSLAAILGGLGHAAYAAANLALDAAARERRRAGGLPWVTVDWDGWLLGEEPQEALGGTHRLALSGAEGADALRRILGQEDLAQVIVSTAPLAARLARWSAIGERPEIPSGERHGRPDLDTGFAVPRDEFEAEIAGVWADLLGLERVGIYDNFYELGGDSLLAIHAATRLTRSLGIEITGALLLASPTVAELVVALLDKLAAGESDESLAAELAAIEAELEATRQS